MVNVPPVISVIAADRADANAAIAVGSNFSVGLLEHRGSMPHLTAGRPSPDC
jgi:hypothetical protein